MAKKLKPDTTATDVENTTSEEAETKKETKAKKPAAKKTPAKTPEGMVTVKELSEEFGIESADIRKVLRANGLKAPKIEVPEGEFGPRSKYQWKEGSKELQEVKDYIQKAIDEEDAE